MHKVSHFFLLNVANISCKKKRETNVIHIFKYDFINVLLKSYNKIVKWQLVFHLTSRGDRSVTFISFSF